MTEQLMTNLYRISVPLPQNPLKELNCYLIREGDRALLIDTGFRREECRQALEEGLGALGVDREKMDILLTHLHSDHSGLAPDLIAPGRRIYISAADRKNLENEEGVAQHWLRFHQRYRLGGVGQELIEAMNEENPAVQHAPRFGCTQYSTLEDGDVLEVGGYRLRVMLTPGHTPGHLCLWEQEQGLLFSGDHVLFDITPNITVWPDYPDALGAYLRSLKEISALPVKRTFPAHRKTGDFHARVKELLHHHALRLAEVEEIAARRPGQTAYEIAGQMTWRIRAKSWAEFPRAQQFFAIGECIAHLDHLAAVGRLAVWQDGDVLRYERKKSTG